MTVDNQVAVYSFIYDSFYTRLDGPSLVDSDAHRFTAITLLSTEVTRPIANLDPKSEAKTVQLSYVPASIKILVSDSSKYPEQTAEQRANEPLLLHSRWPNFEVLDSGSLIVAGAEAKLLSYQVDSLFASWPVEYHVRIVFDLNGRGWTIEATARNDSSKARIKADLDTIIGALRVAR